MKILFTSTVPNSTSRRMHSPSLSLLGVNTSNCLQWLLFWLQNFWHLVPLYIILQYWHGTHAMVWKWRLIMSLFLKSGPSKIPTTSCHKQKPLVWKTHHARNITWRHMIFLLQSNTFHVMWTSRCTLKSWCTNHRPSISRKNMPLQTTESHVKQKHVQIVIFVASKWVNITLLSNTFLV